MMPMIRKLIDELGQKYLGGHVNIGSATIYGWNAMHIAVNVWSKHLGAYVCFHPTTRVFGGHWPWYLYVSRDATPHSAIVAFGPGVEKSDMVRVRERIDRASWRSESKPATGVGRDWS